MATNKNFNPQKGPFNAVVRANKQIGQRFYRLGLEFSGAGAEAFGNSRPGQFAQINLSETPLPPPEKMPENLRDAACRKILLRRPFSFCNVSTKENKTLVEILYGLVGPASLRMTTLSSHDSVSVIGPLGNGFRVPEKKEMAILVTGGMGAGPLIYLAKVLTDKHHDTKVIAFAGAKTKTELPFEKPLDELAQELGFSLAEFTRYGLESLVATDDGSLGYHGLITDRVSEWLGQCNLARKDMIIYSCGPEAMLARTAEIAAERNIDCQVSTERRMACGIGLCQSCAVECKADNTNETVYKLCCEDGPVFDADKVIFRARIDGDLQK